MKDKIIGSSIILLGIIEVFVIQGRTPLWELFVICNSVAFVLIGILKFLGEK